MRRYLSWARRLGVALVVAGALGYLPHHMFGRTGLEHVLALRRTVHELGQRRVVLVAENEELGARAASLKGDPRALERVARDELGLVKQGEILYHVQTEPEPREGIAGARGSRP